MEELAPQQKPIKVNLTCALCNNQFNSTTHEPIYLNCCEEVACRQCVQQTMIKADDKTVIVKGQFECSFCHHDHCASSEHPNRMPLKIDKYVRKLLSSSFKTPLIYCKDHPHKLVKNYCTRHKSLHCNRCIIEKHVDHLNEQKTVIN